MEAVGRRVWPTCRVEKGEYENSVTKGLTGGIITKVFRGRTAKASGRRYVPWTHKRSRLFSQEAGEGVLF